MLETTFCICFPVLHSWLFPWHTQPQRHRLHHHHHRAFAAPVDEKITRMTHKAVTLKLLLADPIYLHSILYQDLVFGGFTWRSQKRHRHLKPKKEHLGQLKQSQPPTSECHSKADLLLLSESLPPFPIESHSGATSHWRHSSAHSWGVGGSSNSKYRNSNRFYYSFVPSRFLDDKKKDSPCAVMYFLPFADPFYQAIPSILVQLPVLTLVAASWLSMQVPNSDSYQPGNHQKKKLHASSIIIPKRSLTWQAIHVYITVWYIWVLFLSHPSLHIFSTPPGIPGGGMPGGMPGIPGGTIPLRRWAPLLVGRVGDLHRHHSSLLFVLDKTPQKPML